MIPAADYHWSCKWTDFANLDPAVAKTTSASCRFRCAKKKMWDKGVRQLCPKGKKFEEFVRNAMQEEMKITDPGFAHVALGYCTKVVDMKLGKLWHNQVSSYRLALKKCECFQ